MMKYCLSILFVCCCSNIYAQSLQGFYTGELKVSGRNIRMSLQLDLLEDGGKFKTVLRSRFLENNRVTGCDNWLEGIMQKQNLVLKNLATIKEHEVPSGACNQIGMLKLVQNKKSTEPEFSGIWLDASGEVFGRLTLKKVDTEVSYFVADEEAIARKNIAETQIASTFNDSLRFELMRKARGAAWLDTITIKGKEANISITAPEADLFHKLTILVDNQPVLINSAPRQQGAIIRLKEMNEGYAEILFLCNHFLVDVGYDIKVNIEWAGGSHNLVVPVSTFKNQGLVLRFVNGE
jgi:hypothetical protein